MRPQRTGRVLPGVSRSPRWPSSRASFVEITLKPRKVRKEREESGTLPDIQLRSSPFVPVPSHYVPLNHALKQKERDPRQPKARHETQMPISKSSSTAGHPLAHPSDFRGSFAEHAHSALSASALGSESKRYSRVLCARLSTIISLPRYYTFPANFISRVLRAM